MRLMMRGLTLGPDGLPVRPLLPAALVLLSVLASPAEAQQARSAEIVPSGALRVGFQTASPILARRSPDGSASGVVVALSKRFGGAAAMAVRARPVQNRARLAKL